MSDEQPGSSARREALMVWLKLLGLLVAVFAFGVVVLEMRRVFGGH